MFGNDETALKQTLVEMARSAWDNSMGQGVDPTTKLNEYIRSDLRFKDYDPATLANETMTRVRQGGSRHIDLEANLLCKPTNRYKGGRVAS